MSDDIVAESLTLHVEADPRSADDGTIDVHRRSAIGFSPIVRIRFHELDRVIEILQRAKAEIEKQREPIA